MERTTTTELTGHRWSLMPEQYNQKNMSLHIDTGNMYSTRVGPEGVSPSDVGDITEVLKRAHEQVMRLTKGGLEAPYASLTLDEHMQDALPLIQQKARDIRRYREVIVIGIGGSSLGAKALRHALMPNGTTVPRLHFVENVDPFDLDYLLTHLSPADTAVICISKSGGTIETVVQYLILRRWLRDRLGAEEAKQRQWIVTDPEKGWLRDLVRREGLASLPVPPQVGGRYSVLTAVGLLPLAVIGVDVGALLDGANANAARCRSERVQDNPALEMAALYFLLDRRRGKRVSVMMPYVNRLRLFVDWYCQLWAESLGKSNAADGKPAGTLPVRAMGAVDQHSQLQMYLESWHDKMFTFIELAEWEHDVLIPVAGEDSQAFPYLAGKTVADVIHAEFRATRQVITETGHPNMTIQMPRMNAHALGQLIDLYQRVTVYTALLYGINPLDQPSVEKGKKLAVRYLSQNT
jgi:glucose-6-phosphate isomerase